MKCKICYKNETNNTSGICGKCMNRWNFIEIKIVDKESDKQNNKKVVNGYFVVFAKDKPQRLELVIEDSNFLSLIDELCRRYEVFDRVELIVFAIKALAEIRNTNSKLR